MPRGDGTGPLGQGPMTGRAAGRCTGNPTPGFFNRFMGNRFGGGRRRMGLGMRGRRIGYGRDLAGSIKSMWQQLDGIEKKIRGLRNR